MANVTIRESAVVESKPAAPVKDTVTDSKGRVIKLRELDPLQESRLILAAGPKASINPVYMNMYVFPAAKVESIDEDFYGLPQTQPQIDSILQVLGREGMEAINAHLFPTEPNADLAIGEAEKN